MIGAPAICAATQLFWKIIIAKHAIETTAYIVIHGEIAILAMKRTQEFGSIIVSLGTMTCTALPAISTQCTTETALLALIIAMDTQM